MRKTKAKAIAILASALLALLLAGFLCLSPVNWAKAAEVEGEGSESVTEDKTITLDGDAQMSYVIEEGYTVTIDLNGHTLTNEDGCHTIVNHGTLTIVDNSTEKDKEPTAAAAGSLS